MQTVQCAPDRNCQSTRHGEPSTSKAQKPKEKLWLNSCSPTETTSTSKKYIPTTAQAYQYQPRNGEPATDHPATTGSYIQFPETPAHLEHSGHTSKYRRSWQIPQDSSRKRSPASFPSDLTSTARFGQMFKPRDPTTLSAPTLEAI